MSCPCLESHIILNINFSQTNKSIHPSHNSNSVPGSDLPL